MATVVHGTFAGSLRFFKDARLLRGRFMRYAKAAVAILEPKNIKIDD